MQCIVSTSSWGTFHRETNSQRLRLRMSISEDRLIRMKALSKRPRMSPVLSDDPPIPLRGTPSGPRFDERQTLEPPRSQYLYYTTDPALPIPVFAPNLFHGPKAFTRLVRIERKATQNEDYNAPDVTHTLLVPRDPDECEPSTSSLLPSLMHDAGHVEVDGDNDMEQDMVPVVITTDPDAMRFWRENDADMLKEYPAGRTTGCILRETREMEVILRQHQQADTFEDESSSDSDSDEEDDGGSVGFWLPDLFCVTK